MHLLLLAHAAAAIAAVPVVRRWGDRGVLLTALAPAAALVWVLAVLARDGAGAVRERSVPWVPQLSLDLALRLDPLAAVMVLVVAGVGAVVLVYSAGYFASHAPPGPRAPVTAAEERRTRTRTTSLLVAFSAVMLLLVLADDLLLLYVAWELTTVLSWLLVGGEGRSGSQRRPALQALLVTTAGGLAMLVGLVLLWQVTGTTRISALLADPPAASAGLTAAAVLVLAGAVTKSALVPFTAWLPGAMVAPTPVSAYLHAAAMVKAGVYLVARFSPVFAAVPLWQVLAVALGTATMLVGGWRALRQHDLKLLLAHGTVSQLGFLVALFGAGGRTATVAGAGMLLAHALFKAALFLVVGAVDHTAGTRDVRELSGLARRAPVLLVAAVLAAGSMAGLPPLLGFVAKEAAFEAFSAGLGAGAPGVAGDAAVGALLVLGSVLTAAYSARFLWGAFATKPGLAATSWHAPGGALVGPPLLLGGVGLALGLLPGGVDALAAGVAAGAADRSALGDGTAADPGYHLAVWHGLGPPPLASVLAVGGGAVLFAAGQPVARAGARLAALRPLAAVAPGAVFDRVLAGTLATATQVTKATQRGSLPQYLLAIMLVLLAGPGVAGAAAVAGGGWPARWRWWDHPLQVVAGALVVACAVTATRVRHRRSAVLLVGASGYGVAGLFVLGGAPDLALTQVLVETLTLVVFVLVVRLLPTDFTVRGLDRGTSRSAAHLRRSTRLVVAVATGSVVAGLSAITLGARRATPVSERFGPFAYTFGGGENVVNVTLVDLRGWDTLGEVSVLVVAATGVASLVFLRSRTGGAPRAGGSSPSTTGAPDAGELVAGPLSVSSEDWLPAASILPTARRSVVLELVVRLVFPTVLVLSVFLLFSGHDNPGGGFAGGLVAGLALALRYLAGGRYELGEALRVPPGALLGTGLLVAVAAAAAPLLVGGQPLQSYILYPVLPVLGEVKVVTSVGFDVGVYLIVVGLVLDVLRSLGAEVDRVREETTGGAGTGGPAPDREPVGASG